MWTRTTIPQLEALELKLLLEAIHGRYGYDFRAYCYASIRRRIRNCLAVEQVRSISGLQEKILHDPPCMERLLFALTVHVTSVFRDPEFYLSFRQRVVPFLRSKNSLRIWHAGCSTGEEVYSMAILLEEEGLLDRCKIYATDMSQTVLDRAKSGIFRLALMKHCNENYLRGGGKRSFSEYIKVDCNHAVFRESLQRQLVFAQHNLATDGSLNEFDVIFCRNTMIYFNPELQNRVHRLIYESLGCSGVLGLGARESLRFTPHEAYYEEIGHLEKLYRKVC